MSNALTLLDDGKMSVPAHIAEALAHEEGNIKERVTVPTLSYEGKVWTISANGEKTKMMKRDENGDETPVPVMRVVVLDYNQRRGRTYYEGAYDPAKPGTPLCWSDDGIAPHASVAAPKASKCEGCPMAIKGSKITEQGKATTACSQHRMLTVVPANNLNFPPLRMKLAITSDWDENPEMANQGWFAFSNYLKKLATRNISHTAAIVTKMRFDPNTAYPKVMFSADRWLEKAEFETAKQLAKSPEVKSLLSGTWSPNGTDGQKLIQAQAIEVEAPVVKTAKPALKVVQPDDDDEDLPFANNKPMKTIKVMDDDDEDVEVVKPKKASKVIHKEEDQPIASKKSAPATSLSAELEELADAWGDD